MAALSIDLPDELRTKLETRAAESGFANLQSYVEAMLRADATGDPLVEEERLEPLLLERLAGPFVDADQADFQQIRAKLQQRLDSRAGEEPQPQAGK